MFSSIPDDEKELLEKAARLISGKWDETTERVLSAMFMETAQHHQRAGGQSHRNWCRSMKALGKTILAIAEREKPVTE